MLRTAVKSTASLSAKETIDGLETSQAVRTPHAYLVVHNFLSMVMGEADFITRRISKEIKH